MRVFVLALLPLPALAAEGDVMLRCDFTSECVADDPCAATDYGFDLGYAPDAAPMTLSARVSDVAESYLALPVMSEGELAGFVSMAGTDLGDETGEAHRMLSLDPSSGAALYTVHLTQAAMSLRYMGACKEIE